MDAVTTATTIIGLIEQLTALYAQYQAAQSAGDQATLDTVSARIVSMSNALAPVGGEAAVGVVD